MAGDMRAFILRHPVPAYFALAFAISWGAVLLIVGGHTAIAAPETQKDTLLPLVLLAMLAGPSVAGILVTGLVHGRTGVRECLGGLLAWRVGARWYAVALLTAPLLAAAVLLLFSFVSPELVAALLTVDDKATLLLSGLAVGLMAGVFEELGWTGFAVPQLRVRHGVLTTGLIVGMLWGGWHLIMVVGGIDNGSASPPSPLIVALALFSVLPAFRVLMVWVYDHTGSLLLAMLMHASLTATTLIAMPQPMAVPRLDDRVRDVPAIEERQAATKATTK